MRNCNIPLKFQMALSQFFSSSKFIALGIMKELQLQGLSFIKVKYKCPILLLLLLFATLILFSDVSLW